MIDPDPPEEDRPGITEPDYDEYKGEGCVKDILNTYNPEEIPF